MLENNYKLKIFQKLSENILTDVDNIESKIFEKPYSLAKIANKLQSKKHILILIYYHEDIPVAFKVGYEKTEKFHSWIGGVDPLHRRKGLAKKLMFKQHQLLKDLGFTIVSTYTDDRFPEMIKLNLQCGFQLVDRKICVNGLEKLIFEKKL